MPTRINHRLYKRKPVSFSKEKPVEFKITRECLSCLNKFEANSRFIRICPKCKASNRDYLGPDATRHYVKGGRYE